MKDNIVKHKSFLFAVRIVNLYKHLCESDKEYVLSKQLLRSGTSIGAMIRESKHSESKLNFIHKLAIAQKECSETMYWIELLHETKYLSDPEFQSIHNDAEELIKLLAAIIKTTKANL